MAGCYIIAAMREDDRIEETTTPARLDSEGSEPVAYIPACGTLCDAFWWARRSDPNKPSD